MDARADLAQRADGMANAAAGAAKQVVKAGQGPEDAGVFLLVGLVGVALICRRLAVVARRTGAVDLGEDEGETRQRILEIEMQDILHEFGEGDAMLLAEIGNM